MEEKDVWKEHFGTLSEILVNELPKDFERHNFLEAIYLDKEGWHREVEHRHRVILREPDFDEICKQGRFLYHCTSEKNGTQVYVLYEKADSKL